MEFDFDDPSLKAALALHEGQERQGPGSRATTELLLDLAAPLPERPRVLDLGSGTGAATLVLARIEGARVTAVDVYTPFLEQLRAAAETEGVADRVDVRHGSMADLDDLPDGSFDLIWSEGAAYNIGFGAALASWRRLLSPEGVLVVTECGWITDEPSAEARAYWDAAYPLRSTGENVDQATAAGYTVTATYLLPASDWVETYYAPLDRRAEQTDPDDPHAAAAAEDLRREYRLYREHGHEYGYVGYVLRPR
ncbi:MAG TPA: class I SAM-dependent methyltransferase [Nocardiopsis listeri]|uniref:SAM-dependent methyltransferase n=1 Tax=Nocardiopsis listeri TaxID=53440 RepID=UPI001D865552|nr:class I SAM-dependent methyltransferase [Nocardiopsis listeri]HJE58703.1 class I SAM-dependent methyltransferase [Nocardiopsis listeri]